MQRISSVPPSNSPEALSFSANTVEQQPKVSLENPKDTFESRSGKGAVLVAGVAGAAGAGFGATPLAQYFVKKKVDKTMESVGKAVNTLLFKDLSKDEFAEIIKKLQKREITGNQVISIVSDKLPESLKALDLKEEQIKAITEEAKPLFEKIKSTDFSKMTPEQIESMRATFNNYRNQGFTMLGEMGLGNTEHLSKIGLTPEEIAKIMPEGTNLETLTEEVRGAKAQELGQLIREKSSKQAGELGGKIKKAIDPIKDELIKQFVKVPGKYKAIAAAVGGLSLAGLVAIVKPSKKSRS